MLFNATDNPTYCTNKQVVSASVCREQRSLMLYLYINNVYILCLITESKLEIANLYKCKGELFYFAEISLYCLGTDTYFEVGQVQSFESWLHLTEHGIRKENKKQEDKKRDIRPKFMSVEYLGLYHRMIRCLRYFLCKNCISFQR